MNKNKFSKSARKTTTSVAIPPKFEEIPTRKLLTAYGGPGSIVETRSGAVLIEPFSEWPAFKRFIPQEENLDDLRLVKRLRNWYPGLQRLVQMPLNGLREGFIPEDRTATVKARYFPEWMFSPKTRRFAPLSEWQAHWQSITQKYGDTTAKEAFHPPKCWESYRDWKEGKEKVKYRDLEQVRFVMISPNGHLCDVPWDRWVFARTDKQPEGQMTEGGLTDEGPEEGQAGTVWVDFDKPIPKNVSYRYYVSDARSDLSGIWVHAYDDQGKEIARRSLAGLFNLRVPQKCLFPKAPFGRDLMKVVIRSSNSVYYANTISSLYLPIQQKELWPAEAIALVKKRHEQNKSAEYIADLLDDVLKLKRTPAQVQQLIDNQFVSPEENDTEAEEAQYRQSEFTFITSQEKPYHHDNKKLSLEPVPQLASLIPGLAMIYRVDQLTLTTVQTSFTRQEPLDPTFYLSEEDSSRQDGVVIRKRHTANWRRDSIRYFPAVESRGEGLFFAFDESNLSAWLMEAKGKAVAERADVIQRNYNQNRMNRPPRTVDAKFVLIHTFSHLLIKELEFLCGYPATSLQERLYVGPSMQGVLIYTIAGTESSYGGLTLLAKSEQLVKIVKSALLRATDCASDPICYHTGDDGHGQGVGGTSLAACYSCAMLPETSCEEFNRFLDRKLVVDEQIGYFGKIIK